MSTIAVPSPPTPALLSRPQVADRQRAFDVASELSDTAVAWRIRDLTTGEEESYLRPRVRGEEVLESLTGEVAGWIDARAAEGPVSVRCFSVALRDAIGEMLEPGRFAAADLIALNSSAAWGHRARAELRDQLAKFDRDEFHRQVLYAASDGSAHPVYGNGAYAWVTSEGEWHVARSRVTILASEVMAILSFARHFTASGRHFRAVLFVDSLHAINAVTGGSFISSRIDQDMLERARALVANGRLELVWVRSHRGHPLNDIADRLALQRHRAIRSQLSQEQIEALSQQIVDGAADVLTGTDWRELARSARIAHRSHLRDHHAA